MEYVTRTIAGALLQTTQLLGLPLSIKLNSTLNQKFGIHQDLIIADTDIPAVKYVTIGNGGHKMVIGANGISKPEPIQHRPRDAALYNHLPFILRLPSEDLTPGERAKYRLRRIESHDNVAYVAYYLKVIDFTETVPKLELRTVADGNITSTDFNFTLADLSPTPPAIEPGGVLTTTGDYIAATAKVPFTMTPYDITEFLNVCNIIYGDEGYAMISEIGLCSGVDRNVTGDFNGVSVGYTDAVSVQIVNFINAFFAANFSNDGITIMLDTGSLEVMLDLA